MEKRRCRPDGMRGTILVLKIQGTILGALQIIRSPFCVNTHLLPSHLSTQEGLSGSVHVWREQMELRAAKKGSSIPAESPERFMYHLISAL